MFNKKRVLAIVLVFSLVFVAVACDDDDQELINQTLDTFEAGIEAGNVEEIESVLASEVMDVAFDESYSGEDFAIEMAELGGFYTQLYEGSTFFFEIKDRELEEIEDQSSIKVKVTIYYGVREDSEIFAQEIMAKLDEFEEEIEEDGYDTVKLRQAAEALVEDDLDQARAYFLEAGFTAEDFDYSLNYNSEKEDEFLGLIKDNGVWYINAIG